MCVFRRTNQLEIHNQYIGFQARKMLSDQSATSGGTTSDEDKRKKAVLLKKKTVKRKGIDCCTDLAVLFLNLIG